MYEIKYFLFLISHKHLISLCLAYICFNIFENFVSWLVDFEKKWKIIFTRLGVIFIGSY